MPRHFSECGLCGAPGHGVKKCPLRQLQAQQDPFGTKRRPVRAYEPVDPAMRDATPRTMFLPGARV
jgi:hypothetical protein